MPRLPILLSLALIVGCNEAPTPSAATIQPTAPTTLEDLRLVVGEATDPNRSDSPTQIIRWALNGQEIPTLNDRKVIPSSMTSAGDVWTAKIIASDGKLDSIPRTVSTTILNTQAQGVVRFEDETPEPGEALVAIATFADIDDHDVELTWHWAVNDQATPYDEPIIPAGVTEKGQRWTVSVVGDDGTASSDAAQRSVIIGNSAPIVRAVSLSPAGAAAGEDIVATVAATDPDGDPLVFRYTWLVDGEPVDETSGQLDGSALERDQRVDVWVVATDGTATSTPMVAGIVIENTPPTIEAVSLNRDQATAADALSCVVAGVSDLDADDVELSYFWSVNDDFVWWEADLEAEIQRGDEVRCIVVGIDGTDPSTPAHSPLLVIDNARPTDDGLAFTTAQPRAGADIGVSFINPADADGDALIEAFAWSVNGSPVQEGPWLEAGKFVRGDSISVSATLSDGIDRGEVRTLQTTIANAAPVIRDIILTGSPTTGDLNVAVTTVDADNDAVNVTYDWFINGTSAGVTTASLDGSRTQRGDFVSVNVHATDGMGGEVTARSGIISVSNRAPTLGEVTTDVQTAAVGDVVTAVFAPAIDPDGDDITYGYAWRINGNTIGTESSVTIPEGSTGDLTVTVTPADTFGTGDSVSSIAIPLENQAPTLVSVTITPPSGARVGSVLSLDWAATDAENDELEPNITWFVNGQAIDADGINLAVAGVASKGDDISASLQLSDGNNTSDVVTAAPITIENTAPTPLELSFEPSVIEPDVALKCAVNGLADADNDDLTISINWFADGEPYNGTTSDGSYEGDTLPSDVVGLFETWECQGSASDGTTASTTQVIDDDVDHGDDNIIGTYTADSHVMYRVRAVELPETDAQSSYAQACTDVGAAPVSCDPDELGASYDASAYGAVAFDTATYACDVSAAVSDLTGWLGLVSFHQPAVDTRGVCEEGCIESSPVAHPLCVVLND